MGGSLSRDGNGTRDFCLAIASRTRVKGSAVGLAIAGALLAVGCATGARYSATVSSLARPVVIDRAALIFPGNAGVDPSDLEFDEFRAYAAAALSHAGYTIVTEPERLSPRGVIVLLEYRIAGARTVVSTREVPEFGMVPTGEFTISSSPNSVTVREQQRFGVTGYREERRSRTVHVRELLLTAYVADSVRRGSPMAVWRLEIASSGRSASLRDAVPPMLFLGRAYIGTNRRARDERRVRTGDEEFQAFRDEARRLRERLNR